MQKLLSAIVIVSGVWSASAHGQMKAADIEAAKAVFSANSCGGCHEVSTRIVGPSAWEIAARYKGKKAEAAVAKRIREGSQDRWGGIAHPAFEALDNKDATLLAKWMLAGAP